MGTVLMDTVLMDSVLLSMFVSLDGFVNDPQGRVGPLYPDPAALAQTAFMQDERLRFTFVTSSIEDAVAQAKLAAGDREVPILGGADTAQQALNAGVVDELEIGVAPVLFGGGTPLFVNLHSVRLERTQVTELFGATILRYRIVH